MTDKRDPFLKFCQETEYAGDYFIVPSKFLTERCDLTPSEWELLLELFSLAHKNGKTIDKIEMGLVAKTLKTSRSFSSQKLKVLIDRGLVVKNVKRMDLSGCWGESEGFTKIPTLLLRRRESFGLTKPNQMRCLLALYNLSFYQEIFVGATGLAKKAGCSFNTAKKWLNDFEGSLVKKKVTDEGYDSKQILSLAPFYAKARIVFQNQSTQETGDGPNIEAFMNNVGATYDQLLKNKFFRHLTKSDPRMAKKTEAIPAEEIGKLVDLYMLENKVNPLIFRDKYLKYCEVYNRYSSLIIESGKEPCLEFIKRAKYLAAHYEEMRLEQYKAEITTQTGFNAWEEFSSESL